MRKLVMLWRLLLVTLPAPVLRIISPGTETYRGNPIDTKARALGRLANFIRVPGILPTVAESRAQLQKTVALFDAKGPELAVVRDITVKGADGDLPARLYSDNSDSDNPALVYFHGGGFIQGDLESHHQLCLKLAQQSRVSVIAVDYRLAPEHPFPAGVDDALAAFRDIHARASELGLDPARIGVGGDSAGGSFSAVVALACKGKKARPWFQLLIYPITDGHMDSEAINDLKDGYILTKQRMLWYRELYAGAFSDFNDPKFSPLLAKDHTDLPPAYILTGGFDPVVDDGRLYAEKLTAAGVNVTHRHYPGQIHAFLNLTKVIPEGRQAITEISDWIRALF